MKRFGSGSGNLWYFAADDDVDNDDADDGDDGDVYADDVDDGDVDRRVCYLRRGQWLSIIKVQSAGKRASHT